MRTRYIACALALGFGVQPIESNDIDPTTLTATGIAIFGCVTGYGIYKQHRDQQNAKEAVTHLQNTLSDIQHKNQNLIARWQQHLSHAQCIQTIGSTSHKSFDDIRNKITRDISRLDTAYERAINQVEVTQFPALRRKLEELKPDYYQTRGTLEAVSQFLNNYKFQLKAYDTLYRTSKLYYYYYQEPTVDQIVSRFTGEKISWPRVNAVTHMQNWIRSLDDTASHLNAEMGHHAGAAYTHDAGLLNEMYIVRYNLDSACRSLTNSQAYDIERERFRHHEQYQRWIEAENKRREEEEQLRKATESNTKALDEHRKEVERAEHLYQELLNRGVHELPYIRREISNTIDKLDKIEDRHKSGQSVCVKDVRDVKRRLEEVRDHIPRDPHNDMNISFTLNLSRDS